MLEGNGRHVHSLGVHGRGYHATREDAWCDHVDLERALAQLPYDLRMIALMIAEKCTEREMTERLAIPKEILAIWREETMAFLRSQLTP